jgi:hypothetical protein
VDRVIYCETVLKLEIHSDDWRDLNIKKNRHSTIVRIKLSVV